MNNLDRCTQKTRDFVQKILKNPTTRDLAFDTIMTGLTKDSVDAVIDVKLALETLQAIMDDHIKTR